MPCFENRGLSRRARPLSAVSGYFDSLQSTREYIYFFVPNLFIKKLSKNAQVFLLILLTDRLIKFSKIFTLFYSFT